MPEERDNVEQFEDLLNRLSETGLNVGDLDTMSVVIMIRLRSAFTIEQLHVRAHTLIEQCEDWCTTPGALHDEKGNPSTPVLVENFESKEELFDMLKQTRDEITDDDLSALLDEELDV